MGRVRNTEPQATGTRRSGGDLTDSFGRCIRYLRLSVTRACTMQCAYCRPGNAGPLSADALLTPREISDLVGFLTTEHGLGKVRLTGGEPTARPELSEIIARVAETPGLRELCLTTNGLTLAHHAREYARAGLHRVNISLDAIHPLRFARMTGVDGLRHVTRGIEAAHEAGLDPIRLNTVVLRGQNDDEVVPLVRFAAARGLEIRFIELMPMGPLASRFADWHVPTAEVRERLAPHVVSWEPLAQGSGSATRHRVTLDDGATTTVGLISPMSHDFCGSCNRIRIGADGSLYPCLMDRPTGSVLPALRPAVDDALLRRILSEGIARKAACHPEQGFAVMTHMGG